MTTTGQRHAGRALLAVSAVSSGALGWSAAHLVMSRVLAHRHEASHGIAAGISHVHATDLAAVVVALALTATSMLAVTCAAFAAGGRLTAPGKQRLARTAGLWSTGAFLAAETAAWAGSDTHVVPPPIVLLLGLAVHGAAGVVAALLWRAVVERVCVAAAAASPRPLPRPVPLRLAVPGDAGGGSVWSMLRVAGRAPPTLGISR
ncbi:hypothetical protein KZZ52_35675 [Dactylosporangium sp. AC04546]|uniref:hypothetical protein n=1 Tax=Dactylosporangium sp. AC04546 TaxID=2862460 RepID=UPI001EDE334E|nr:hypothetical protein [Dactylosporangium sp. AC04546]WVK79311.1 hypothetical protein KZZ52_35675 [Dactylosporangium sp. AC04546]